MSVLSINGRPAHVIDDTNWRDYVPDENEVVVGPDGEKFFCGLKPPTMGDVLPMRAVPWEASGLVFYDEKEIKERLEDMWAAKASLMHRVYHTDALKQSAGTCWIHGTCQAGMMMFVSANLPYRTLSPLSVAYHCYSNFGVRGGYPATGIAKLQEFGASTVETWPENAASAKYDTAESKAERVHNWLEEVVELGSGEEAFWKSMSAICQGKPCGWSFNWWRHYVCGCWGRVENGEVCGGLRNSWGNSGYGDKGFGLLKGSRKYPSGAYAFLRMRQSVGGK